VGCGGAREAPGCGRGAVKLTNGGEQRVRWWSSGGAEWRRSRGSKMRPREEVKEAEENSWTLCGTKKRHGRAGAVASDLRRNMAAAGDGGTTWRGGEKPAGVGRAAGGSAGGPGGGVRAASGSWQRGSSPVRGCGRWSRAAEKNREGGERGRRRGPLRNFPKEQGVQCKVKFSFKPQPK
jgi:hypothetical protein